MNKQVQAYTFTLFDYSDEHVALLKSLDVTYIVFGFEVCPRTSKPHLQGYLYLKKKKTLKGCKDFIGVNHIHLEAAVKDSKANYDYCTKENNFVEVGERPKSPREKGIGEKERWESARTLAKSGKLDDIDADIYLRIYRTLKEIAKDHMVRPQCNSLLDNHWISGPSGCGKSLGASRKYPGAYYKMCNKWWDGYQNEETVIIEDIDENHKCLIHHLKLWGDHGPFLAETKGGAMYIRPKRIIVTSNLRISDLAEGVHLEALQRRYQVEDHFDPQYSSNFVPPPPSMTASITEL